MKQGRPESVVRGPWFGGVPIALLGLAVFLLALTPRLLARDLFPTSDEDSWMRRSGGFAYGLAHGQLGRTYQNGHPGVTTMWVAMLSQSPDGALRFADRVREQRDVGRVPGYLEGLAQARIGFAVLGALGTALSAALLWQLFGPGPAVVAGLGLAFEPFLVANAQLVHVDGLLAVFMTVSVLAALVRRSAGGGRGFVALSGVATGLALLSKSPAVFLLLFVPLVSLVYRRVPSLPSPLPRGEGGRERRYASFLSPSWCSRPADARPSGSPPSLAGRGAVGLDLALWLGLAVGTVALVWPAIWALGPTEVLGRVWAFSRETGGQPDEVGSFFLGRVGGDPGPLYYPLAALFRMSPFVVIGLLALLVAGRRLTGEVRSRAAWLLLFVVGFGAMMTLGPKKFDRYLLPIFPILVALAAVGIWQILVLLARSSPRRPKDPNPDPSPALEGERSGLGSFAKGGSKGWSPAPGQGRLAAGVAAVVALAIWPLASVYPYPLAHYNPLLGGGAAAQRAVMVGNGEGLDQAGRWIAAQPDAANLRVAAHSWDILAALVPADGEPLREGLPEDADYIVTYGRRIQMGRWGPSLERYFAANPPVHTVRIASIEYVRIHPGPRLGRQS